MRLKRTNQRISLRYLLVCLVMAALLSGQAAAAIPAFADCGCCRDREKIGSAFPGHKPACCPSANNPSCCHVDSLPMSAADMALTTVSRVESSRLAACKNVTQWELLQTLVKNFPTGIDSRLPASRAPVPIFLSTLSIRC